MKIAYFGLPLGALLLASDGVDLSLVVLAPVRAPGRRRLSRLLSEVPILDCISGVSDAVIEAWLRKVAPDALLSWFWTRRLPLGWLGLARCGALGVHPSLLPRHRGPDPYFAAIDAGDEYSGATLHRLAEDYDTGVIVDSERVRVGSMDAWQLARAIDRPSLRLLRSAAERLGAGDPLEGVAQDERLATWAGEPEGEQLSVDWSWPTARILRRIRALAPVPGLALSVLGLDFFVVRALSTPAPPLALNAGEAAVQAGRVSIRTGDGAISLEAVRLEDTGQTLRETELASVLEQRRLSGGTDPA